ncbi:MAG TPA: oligoribonuclease [bacterium]|nr:oligoribonuclease [bacterium]
MPPDPKNNLVWMDLEMSGLDPKTCQILEIATLITDKDLNLVAQGPALVIHQPDSVLDAMDDWNKKHHGDSGLTKAVRESTVSLAEAERLTLEFVTQYCVAKSSPLCGNTIYQDRRFLIEYMPKLEEYLHYRLVDVSTIKELVKRWYGPEFQAPGKKQKHKALDDIQETIEELRFYREKVFKKD